MNLGSIDLNLLLVFEALMDERNVTRAARRVGLSQPATSNALARLRRTFDDPLLVRGPGGLSPTPRAVSLAGPIRDALARLRAAIEESPAFDAAAASRTFRLLANDYLEARLVPALVRRVGEEAPGVSLQVRRAEMLFVAPSAAVLAAEADLAVGFFPDPLSLETGIRAWELWQEPNVCIARTGHPAIRGSLSLREYASAGHAAIFYKTQGPGVVDTLLAQHGLVRRLVCVAPHFATVAEVVAGSDLVATVPEGLARRAAPVLGLQVLDLPLSLPPLHVSMLWHERHDADPAHGWLRSVAQSLIHEDEPDE
jgi:DNA-binding transcriptional LysR family regulator